MANRKHTVGRYSSLYPNDMAMLTTPPGWIPSSTSRIIIGCHGRGGTATQYSDPPIEQHVLGLVNAGYAVLGVDHARINSWGDPDAMRALDDAYTYATTTLGVTNTKVGFMGWSMGGGTALNWIKRNPAKVSCAWLWNPLTDLRFFRDAAGAYTPAYPLGGATTQGTFTTEINAVYASTNTVATTQTIPASGGAGVTLAMNAFSVGNVFADGHNNAVVGKPQATVNGTAFTYTGKTDTSLTGCVSTTASTITATAGLAVTSSYATQSNGYRIQDEVAQWAANGVTIKICQASDDTTVPPGQNTDVTNGFVARVNSSNVTARTAPTGGHINSILNVPASEVVAFYTANL